MPQCCAVNCDSKAERCCRLFRIPQGQRNAERRKIWLHRIGREDTFPYEYARLCEIHFTPYQFEMNRKDGVKKLKNNAIPTIFSHNFQRKERKPPTERSVQNYSDCTYNAQAELVTEPSCVIHEDVLPDFSCPVVEVPFENVAEMENLQPKFQSLQKKQHIANDKIATNTASVKQFLNDDQLPACSKIKHFADDQWEKLRVDGKKKLKCNAVPTIFPDTVTKTPTKQSKKCLTSPSQDSEETSDATVEMQNISQPSSQSTAPMGDTENQRGSLADDFAALLNSGFNADITLHAGSFKMLAHKTVLVARSPFFATILKNNRPNCHLELHDVEADVLLQLVIFMYTDRVPDLQNVAPKLLLAAEKLRLPVLEQKCKEQIAQDKCKERLESKERIAADALLAVRNACNRQKRPAAVLEDTRTVREAKVEHHTEVSQNPVQVVAEKNDAKKIKLESFVQNSGNGRSAPVASPKPPLQTAEKRCVVNGASPKIIVKTVDKMPQLKRILPKPSVQPTNKGSPVNGKLPKIPVQANAEGSSIQGFLAILRLQPTVQEPCLIGPLPKIPVQGTSEISNLNVKPPTVPAQATKNGSCLNVVPPTVFVQATEKESRLNGKSPTISVQAADKESRLNGKSPTISVQAADKESGLNGKSPTIFIQAADKESSLNGKSPTISIQAADKESRLNGKSPTVSVQAADKGSHVKGKAPPVSVQGICLNGKSPTAPVQPADDRSHINGNSPTLPVQFKTEEPLLNGKDPKLEVQTAAEELCMNESLPLVPEVIIKEKSSKTPARTAKHRLSVKGAPVNSRASAGASGTQKTKHTLHSAAECGCLEDLRTLLAQGADVDARDKKKRTALLLAAENGHEEVVKCLLQEGANVDAQDHDKWTPVHWATHNGHEEVVRGLLFAGADVSIRNRWQSTPLHSAAAWGYVNIAHMLLVNSADVNAKDKDGSTPLHCAAKWCQMEVAEVLLQADADSSAKDRKGKMPLDMVRKLKQQQWAAIMR